MTDNFTNIEYTRFQKYVIQRLSEKKKFFRFGELCEPVLKNKKVYLRYEKNALGFRRKMELVIGKFF